MMLAITLGMSVDLTVGVILGILFSDNLFIATVLGMLTRIIVKMISQQVNNGVNFYRSPLITVIFLIFIIVIRIFLQGM